jgi:hypothetical protein
VPTNAYLLEVAEEAGVGAASTPQQQQQQQQDVEQPVQPLSLQLSPLMQLPCSAVGGSMASCCSWLPAAPYDQLLVGCWDGNVAIWQLPTTAGGLGGGTCFMFLAWAATTCTLVGSRVQMVPGHGSVSSLSHVRACVD